MGSGYFLAPSRSIPVYPRPVTSRPLTTNTAYLKHRSLAVNDGAAAGTAAWPKLAGRPRLSAPRCRGQAHYRSEAVLPVPIVSDGRGRCRLTGTAAG